MKGRVLANFPMTRTFSILNVYVVRVLEYVRSDKESWHVVRLALCYDTTLHWILICTAEVIELLLVLL
mgnify:CR=1 FL=1